MKGIFIGIRSDEIKKGLANITHVEWQEIRVADWEENTGTLVKGDLLNATTAVLLQSCQWSN